MASVVDVARTVYERFDNGDLNGALALMTEDVEVRSVAGASMRTRSVGHGHEGLRAWWNGVRSQDRILRFLVRDVREFNERAICKIAISNVQDNLWDVATVVWIVINLDDDGLVSGVWSYRTEAEAEASAAAGRMLD